MKNQTTFAFSFALASLFIFGITTVQAQSDYKHPPINAKGEFLDAKGNKQGRAPRRRH